MIIKNKWILCTTLRSDQEVSKGDSLIIYDDLKIKGIPRKQLRKTLCRSYSMVKQEDIVIDTDNDRIDKPQY
ncbi:hypothetical protein J14TS5_21990 [Paenibacillus lautus]|nr:hypothetical protein J14TS5_21990 [Paenibacillus lautus]